MIATPPSRVTLLQELNAASWSDAQIATAVRAGCKVWTDLITELARKAEHELGGLGPFTPEEVGALIGGAFVGAQCLGLELN